jgi:hypothetical protein
MRRREEEDWKVCSGQRNERERETCQVVLKVLAHARGIDDALDVERCEVFFRADT